MRKQLRALIIDDEIGSIDSLAWELEPFSKDVIIIGKTQDPFEGLKMIENLSPDLVFLDISMPGMNGFELLESIEHVDFNVVFTTAFDQYAVDAFKANAIDYLLKPVLPEDIERVIEKIRLNSGTNNLQENLKAFLDEFQNMNKSLDTIALPTMEGLEFVEISQIIRCESSSNYTFVHQRNEKPILISKTLKDVEKMLSNQGFIRIHQSHLVNIKSIKKYLKGKSGSLILKDGSVIPVSRSKKGEFLDKF